MATDSDDSETRIRTRLLELIEDDEWKLSERARREGKSALRSLYDREPTDWELVEFVIDLLESDTTMRSAPQGDPPGATGVAWQMTDANNIFVKLQICEQRIGQEYAFIQSIHESVYPKKT